MKGPSTTEGSMIGDNNMSLILGKNTTGRIYVQDDKETDEKVDAFLKDY